jgi:predicted ATPase/DNA-binding CsgD family transcriptional regulator
MTGRPDRRVPVPLTTLVGRSDEVETLVGMLRADRIVSLVGPGGAGKTRLATELAHRAQAGFADGACWVELGHLGGGGLVSSAVLGRLGIIQSPDDDPLDLVLRQLRDSEVLVVLDNCEHLIDECAMVADNLLGSCPGVTIVATSREPLVLPGERVHRLSGLAEAAELFVSRARSCTPGFTAGPEHLQVIASICERLDRLPLAVELAAARTRMMSVDEIASRLEGETDLLQQHSRTAPARHQTLESTLEWSHRLLLPLEQILFRRLSVFEGSFSLLAAEAVGAGEGIEEKEVLGLLGGLVDKSLVQVADRGSEHRYQLLNTVRAFAEAKLAASPERDRMWQAHADFFAGLVHQAEVGFEGPDQARWLERLELEHDNIRAALRRHLPGSAETAGRIAGPLWPFWYRRGYYYEARSWFEQLIGWTEQMEPKVGASVLTGAGVLAFLQCDYVMADDRLRAALALYERLGEEVGVATVRQRLGSIAREQARYADAVELHRSARDLWEKVGDPTGVAASDDYLAFAAWLQGDAATAEAHGLAALSCFRAAGMRQETAFALVNLGMAAHCAGDERVAVDCLGEALSISRDIGYLEGVAWAAHELGSITFGSDDRAGAWLREALETHVALGDRWRAASVLETAAVKLLAPADAPRAVRVLAASSSLRDQLGTPVPPVERAELEAGLERLRGRLGEAAFARAWAAGLGVRLDDAVALVAADAAPASVDAPDLSAPPPTEALPYELTRREVDVLRLISDGFTNRQIGKELYISPGTAAVHVSNILRKLGVGTRVEAAGIAYRLGLSVPSR